MPDTTAAEAYCAAFGVGAHVGVCVSEAPTTGFRGYTLLLGVEDVKTSKQFYVDRGLAVTKSVTGSDAGPFTDPDGFAWEPASA